MADDLAARIRAAIGHDSREIRMFGGVCFMTRGNMLVCAMKDGSMLARVGVEAMPSALALRGVARMTMSGREMKDFVVVEGPALRGAALGAWIDRALAYVDSLPEKAEKPKKAVAKS